MLDVSAGWEAVAAVRIQAKNRREYQRVRRRLADGGAVEVSVARTADEVVPALHE